MSSRKVKQPTPSPSGGGPADCKRPNFLLIMTDENRFPPVYETPEVRVWRETHLLAQEFLRARGLEFLSHYVGATACSPSRASLFTGQYPSLHGVSQTTGAAKEAFDPDVFWLDRNTLPTMGNYFRTAGYRTFYKGKWHVSDEDILIPDTHNAFPSYDPSNGVPNPEAERIYRNADRLDKYGFAGWIGPEPHGRNPRNSGSSAAVGLSGRDEVFAAEVVELITALGADQTPTQSAEPAPWLLVASFVNPHDIALFGDFTRLDPTFRFHVDPSVPDIPPAPTAMESLLTKPQAQESYRETYPKALQPLQDTLFYRRLYYSLQLQVDREMRRILRALQDSGLADNTIVIFTSDHGDLLGAHGGLFQKWYCVYEEAIHVPMILHNPRLFDRGQTTDMLTSHLDLLPTMLGLAGVDVRAAQEALRRDHNEVHPFVGRDLAPLILGAGQPDRAGEPLYFMTDDDVTRGLNQTSVLGRPYTSVVQPNHIEAVITLVPTADGPQTFKYARYFDNPQFWSDPGCKDVVIQQHEGTQVTDDITCLLCTKTVKTEPVPDQIEMYNLTADPLETRNLANPEFSSPESLIIQQLLANLLAEQCRQKRLPPSSGNVPGFPSCDSCSTT